MKNLVAGLALGAGLVLGAAAPASAISIIETATVTPIPAALPLFGTALLCLAFVAWRHRKSGAAIAQGALI